MSLSAGTLVYGYPNPNKTIRPYFIGVVLRKSKLGDKVINEFNVPYCYQLFIFHTGEIKPYHIANFSVYEGKI